MKWTSRLSGTYKKGFTLMELIVVIAILAIGFGSATTMLASGSVAFNKVEAQTTDSTLASLLLVEIENEVKYASSTTLYNTYTDSALDTSLSDRIYVVNNRVVVKRGSGTPIQLPGQENLLSTYTISLSFSRPADSSKSIAVQLTLSDTARGSTIPPSTVKTSIIIENLAEGDAVKIQTVQTNPFSLIAYNP